ncbi:VOC family protein [Mizugakiibacter sediminis]|nr:VOC family protein [Mizugakiibacter sediminis]
MASLLVNIDVDDLERAIDYYTRAFGLRLGRRFGGDGAELLGAEAPLYLLAKPAGSVATPAAAATRDYRRHWTPVHLDFVVADIDAAVRAARDAGARQEGDLRTHAWGRIAQFADPFGHGFCLLEFRGRGYDELVAPSK